MQLVNSATPLSMESVATPIDVDVGVEIQKLVKGLAKTRISAEPAVAAGT